MTPRGRMILLMFCGALGIAVFIALSAWLGAFAARSDVAFANDVATAEVNVLSDPGEPGPFRLVITGDRGGPRQAEFPDEAGCQLALRVERAAMERRSAEARRGAPRVWVTSMCVPVSRLPSRAR